MTEVRPLRLLVKAIVFFALANLAFAWLDLPLGKVTIYNWLAPGRVRVPYEQRPEFFALGYNMPIFDDFDAMFGSHAISRPKAADEYRVILLGDSSTWGYDLRPGEILSEQLNSLSLRTCDGKRVRAYDLAYPFPHLMKDLLVLDGAKKYEPDLVVWMVTLYSFEQKSAVRDFLNPHAEQSLELIETYHLNVISPGLHTPTFWERALVSRRKLLKNMALVQLNGLLWGATGIDFHIRAIGKMSENVDADPSYGGVQPPLNIAELMFDVLGAGYQSASPARLLVVNEPIFIATGANSSVRYNTFYPRWAYDQYRQALADWMAQNGHAYLDLWNALPNSVFTDHPLHRSAEGESLLAGRMKAGILRVACEGK